MKLQTFKPAQLSDVPNVPKGSDWVAKYLEPVFSQLKNITLLLQGKASADNLNQELRTISVMDGESVEIQLNKIDGKPVGAALIASDDLISTFTPTPLDVRKIRITVTFTEPRDIAVPVTVLVFGA